MQRPRHSPCPMKRPRHGPPLLAFPSQHTLQGHPEYLLIDQLHPPLQMRALHLAGVRSPIQCWTMPVLCLICQHKDWALLSHIMLKKVSHIATNDKTTLGGRLQWLHRAQHPAPLADRRWWSPSAVCHWRVLCTQPWEQFPSGIAY